MNNQYSTKQKILTHENLTSDIDGFAKLSKVLLDVSGIVLEASEKNYSLMSNRMYPFFKKINITSYNELLDLIKDKNNSVFKEFIELMTTNTTQFFRENEHFNFLKKTIPSIEENILKQKRNTLKIWCAAASTGEEPYTILMTILESLKNKDKIQLQFFATDINYSVLEKAKLGIYKKNILDKVEVALIDKYFEKENNLLKSSKDYIDSYQVKDIYRKMIQFNIQNLMDDKYNFFDKFDIIFCRNVLIYFSLDKVNETVQKMLNYLDCNGYLFIAHSEALVNTKLKIKSVVPAVYQHKI